MAWLRVDDGFPEHAKILALRRSDRWTWVEVLAYCARQNNGGVVPTGLADIVKHATPAFLHKCADAGLLDDTEHGYVVHDWAEYNPRDPTNAVRQQRYRRNAKSNGEVTEETVTATVTTVTPPRARVPSRPQPLTNKEPSLPSNESRPEPPEGQEGLQIGNILKEVDAA